ncbi:MAG: DUF3096 domain-containing protein [Chloroflexi bacterium]|nr:DUF3096 domain-containing protein [Chloroflexota bacterium]
MVFSIPGPGGFIGAIITIIVGIILLVWPRFLAAILGIYLILVGAIALIVQMRS